MKDLVLERTFTALDHARLLNLLRRQAHVDHSSEDLADLEEVLEAGTVVPSRTVSSDFVTMHSRGFLRDAKSGQRYTLTLVYPGDAEPAVGLVSVLSPVGCALIGLQIGSVKRWHTPAGEEKAAEITASTAFSRL